MKNKTAVTDISGQCKDKLMIGPVIGSDLIPLIKIHQPTMTSYNKKRERRERHIKQMMKQHAKSESDLSGMTSALFELAMNSTDIIDLTLVEIWRQVITQLTHLLLFAGGLYLSERPVITTRTLCIGIYLHVGRSG